MSFLFHANEINGVFTFALQDLDKTRVYLKIEFGYLPIVNMSENGRFCVQFSGTEIDSTTKTRILYQESKPKDIRVIWSQVCNSEPPDDIQLIIGSKYRIK